MPKNKFYIEEKRFCEESYCKHLKRLIVGFIRFIESDDQDANIPEHFFDNVPDSLGFKYDYLVAEDGEDIRSFYLTNDWQKGVDDCGGTEEDPGDMTYTYTDPQSNIVHLKLIKND
jgi:hypothetical protein